MRETINPATIHPPAGYSHVIGVTGGTTVYLAGQVAWDSEGNIVGEDDFETQARQVFANLVEALRAAGAEPSQLVKLGIYVVDHDETKLSIIRRVRDEALGGEPRPVSTLLGVAGLAVPGLMIEVDGIAFVEG